MEQRRSIYRMDRADVPLTEKGEEEALNAGRALRGEGFEFDVVFASMLKRVLKTEHIVMDELDQLWVPEVKDWRLNERHYGDCIGKTQPEAEEAFGKENIALWASSYDIAPHPMSADGLFYPKDDRRYREVVDENGVCAIPRTECMKDVSRRVVGYWEEEILPVVRSGKRVLIAGHSNMLKTLLQHLDGIDDDVIVRMKIPRATPMVYDLGEDLKPLRSPDPETLLSAKLLSVDGASAEGDSVAAESPGTSSDPSSHGSGSRGGGGGGGDGGSRGPLTWGAVGLLGIVATLAVGYYRMKWEEKQNRTASEVVSTGKPALGGPFTLVNMHGKPVTDKDYHGSFVMLYFGFCHCPDICPSELVKVGAIATKLEGKLGAGVVKPVFVSVDPDRDSLAQLRHYSQDFHHSIEFLTGTKDQVAKAAKSYRVYFSKTEEHEEGEDYLLDHSIVIYLLAPNGDFLDFFTQRTTIADCVDRTAKHVKDFKA
eukprot:g12608.t2